MVLETNCTRQPEMQLPVNNLAQFFLIFLFFFIYENFNAKDA